ncbi:hypothetical protein [Thermosulfuriphilus sp.]
MHRRVSWIAIIIGLFFLWGCAGTVPPIEEQTSQISIPEVKPKKKEEKKVQAPEKQPEISPRLFEEPRFIVKPVVSELKTGRPYTPVGAEIVSKDGRVRLREVIKKLAELKDISVSWASDVDPNALVDVHIRPEDDLYEAIANVLRQHDYFYELKGNTLIIKYKDTRSYYLAMPFLKESFSSSIGGDLLGAGGESAKDKMSSQLRLDVDSRDIIDFWSDLENNLLVILNGGEKPIEETAGEIPSEPHIPPGLTQSPPTPGSGGNEPSEEAAGSRTIYGKFGYFTVDRPVGLIRVTAPPRVLEEVERYLEDLRKELYRQVVVEAKIIEVELTQATATGINWDDVLHRVLEAAIYFGSEPALKAIEGGIAAYTKVTGSNASETIETSQEYRSHIYPFKGVKFIREISLQPQTFSVILDALRSYGNVKVLANPKISLLNGHGATLTVGTNIAYLKSVSSTTQADTGSVSYSSETDTVFSGVGMSVVANIVSDDEVILYIIPVTSVVEDIQLVEISQNQYVQLPIVQLRNLATFARVKDGELLVLGGLITREEQNQASKVPGLGDAPVVGGMFRHKSQVVQSRELVIVLQPHIISM